MATTSTTNLSITISGQGFSYTYTPPTSAFANSAAPGAVPTNVALVSGNNTITLPTGTQVVLIVPPAGSANAKTLKGVNGDTGIALNPALPTLLTVASSVTSIVINATSGETIQIAYA
jgi:hypothetical protein